MKQAALGIIAIAALMGTPALAAPPPPPVPAWSWTGFYIGANAGGALAHSTWCTDATGPNCETVPLDINTEWNSGLVGGGQFGFRWQAANNVVWGLEGMFDGMRLSGTTPDAIEAALGATGRIRTTSFTDLYSVTGQIGLAWNQGLLYGKAGWAGTRLGLDADNTSPGGLDLSTSEWINGFAVGAGLEYALTHNLSLGVEYVYYGFNPSDIKNLTNSGGVLIDCAFCNFSNTSVQTLTARLNWRFDWAGVVPAPMVTK